MQSIVIYTTKICPYCIRAKQLLEKKGVEYTNIPVDEQPVKRAEMIKLSGRYTVPQIWVGDTHIGGFDDMWALDQRGELDVLLEDVYAYR